MMRINPEITDRFDGKWHNPLLSCFIQFHYVPKACETVAVIIIVVVIVAVVFKPKFICIVGMISETRL